MKVILGGRRSGKTTKLIKISHATNSYIVCPDHKRVQNIIGLAQQSNLSIPYPLTMHEFITKRYSSKNINNFLFDDIDHCLQKLTSVNILAGSLPTERTIDLDTPI